MTHSSWQDHGLLCLVTHLKITPLCIRFLLKSTHDTTFTLIFLPLTVLTYIPTIASNLTYEPKWKTPPLSMWHCFTSLITIHTPRDPSRKVPLSCLLPFLPFTLYPLLDQIKLLSFLGSHWPLFVCFPFSTSSTCVSPCHPLFSTSAIRRYQFSHRSKDSCHPSETHQNRPLIVLDKTQNFTTEIGETPLITTLALTSIPLTSSLMTSSVRS